MKTLIPFSDIYGIHLSKIFWTFELVSAFSITISAEKLEFGRGNLSEIGLRFSDECHVSVFNRREALYL